MKYEIAHPVKTFEDLEAGFKYILEKIEDKPLSYVKLVIFTNEKEEKENDE